MRARRWGIGRGVAVSEVGEDRWSSPRSCIFHTRILYAMDGLCVHHQLGHAERIQRWGRVESSTGARW